MAGVVNIQEIVDELSMMFDEMKAFVDRDTGAVVTVPLEDLRAPEEDGGEDETDEMTEAEEEVDLARVIAQNPGRYAWLPSRHELNSWETLREFCTTVEAPKRRERLLAAIQGLPAFQRSGQ
jgi:hypothetical protein